MENIYSPNRFNSTFPHHDSWNFEKMFKIIKKSNIYALIQIHDFSTFIANFS